MAERIREFICDTFFVDEVADDESFLRSGTIDSTGMIDLVMFVEETYGIEIDDAELVPDNLDSINSLKVFLERKGAALISA